MKLNPDPFTDLYGYSRDHRPDLKQFVMHLICTGDGDVPLYLRLADGNEADSCSVCPVDEGVSATVDIGFCATIPDSESTCSELSDAKARSVVTYDTLRCGRWLENYASLSKKFANY